MSQLLKKLPVLETERLILRPLMETDLDNLRKLETDVDVVRFLGNGQVRTESETKSYLNKHLSDYERYGIGLYAVELKHNCKFIGRSGLIPWTLESELYWEIGYTLTKDYWGKGIATELASFLKMWAKENLDSEFVVSLIKPENEKSIKVARKIGMSYWKKFDVGGYSCDAYRVLL